MTEYKEDADNTCLNCGTLLEGRYCYKCGQDSAEHLDSIWHLVKHFFEDITHYDGKLWKTVKPLIVKPAFLTQEYLRGKRASYLPPVRMFIFLNFIFFFLLLSLPSPEKPKEVVALPPINAPHALPDTAAIDSTLADTAMHTVTVGRAIHLNYSDSDVMTVEKYDSIQKALPAEKKDNRLTQMANRKVLDFLNNLKKDPEYEKEKLNEIFFHNSAKLTFVFLIVCTLLLSLLYRRRHLLMIDHALFSIHLSCTFLSLTVVMLLFNYLSFGMYLNLALFLYGNYYFYRALRNFYNQSTRKTVVKFLIINFCLFAAMLIGVVVNGLITVMSIK